MKVKEWNRLIVTFKKDPEKKLKSLILLSPNTIKRLTEISNKGTSKKTEYFRNLLKKSLDLSWFEMYNIKNIDIFEDLFKVKEGIVVVDCVKNTDYLFILKQKLLTLRFKLKTWFTTTVVKNQCFKKIKKKN